MYRIAEGTFHDNLFIALILLTDVYYILCTELIIWRYQIFNKMCII